MMEAYSNLTERSALLKSNITETVLIVDDSFDFLFLNATILEMEGYQVYTASSGAEALEKISKYKKIDLILLDFLMEDMSGIEFLEMLELEQPEVVENIPIVFFTAMDQIPKSKARGFIRKPIENRVLLEQLREILDNPNSNKL